MGVEGCTKFIKYLLFFCNFIFWLAGGVILGVALWLRHDKQISSLMELELDGTAPPSSFYVCVHILIAVGAVMMVVGFLGCYGAIQESQCLLGTFFVCLVILFACEVAAGIWGYMNRETVSQEMKKFYDSVYDNALLNDLQQEKKSAVAHAVKVFHETLNCCGKGLGTSLISQLLTDSCPKGVTTSCHTKIDELFSDKIYLIGIAALVVAVIMIFEMIFSMVLCCGIRNSPVY
ncbi:CD81 molecule a [Austrofundulus limnaeus]|uniref:Tetraspanin n=1 Tax=Austrofundulus limnaeus TaxID=52670 RepID=A0A2I4B4P0_AUSLI|nr:PREDICTED: CD81 antigen [Austrofundulus limnaeus]